MRQVQPLHTSTENNWTYVEFEHFSALREIIFHSPKEYMATTSPKTHRYRGRRANKIFQLKTRVNVSQAATAQFHYVLNGEDHDEYFYARIPRE